MVHSDSDCDCELPAKRLTFCHFLLIFLFDVAARVKWGVPKIHIVCVLASKQGLMKIAETHPDVSVTVGMVDDVLTENGIVLPGLGDCGNRLYGTDPIIDDDDESLLLPSKRKRLDSQS